MRVCGAVPILRLRRGRLLSAALVLRLSTGSQCPSGLLAGIRAAPISVLFCVSLKHTLGSSILDGLDIKEVTSTTGPVDEDERKSSGSTCLLTQ